jgi:hypothetical protein
MCFYALDISACCGHHQVHMTFCSHSSLYLMYFHPLVIVYKLEVCCAGVLFMKWPYVITLL